MHFRVAGPPVRLGDTRVLCPLVAASKHGWGALRRPVEGKPARRTAAGERAPPRGDGHGGPSTAVGARSPAHGRATATLSIRRALAFRRDVRASRDPSVNARLDDLSAVPISLPQRPGARKCHTPVARVLLLPIPVCDRGPPREPSGGGFETGPQGAFLNHRSEAAFLNHRSEAAFLNHRSEAAFLNHRRGATRPPGHASGGSRKVTVRASASSRARTPSGQVCTWPPCPRLTPVITGMPRSPRRSSRTA